MTSVRESDVIAAARFLAPTFSALLAQFPDVLAGNVKIRVESPGVQRLCEAVAALDTPISYDEVLTAYRQERATLRTFMDNPHGDQDALLLAWDEARTRYMAMLVDYAMGIGITVGKAERGLAAYLAAEVAAS